MSKAPLRNSIIAGCFALAATETAVGAIINVPGDATTIQAAVTAAVAGDTILVAPGVHAEVVTIDAAKTGLEIKGKKGVILDARPLGMDSGAGITVAADDVTISNIVIRHPRGAGSTGHGVHCTAANVTLDKITVGHADAHGILIVGAGAVVKNCLVFAQNGSGGLEAIRIDGAGALVDKTTVRNSRRGLEIVGAGARVSRCKVLSLDEGHGIQITGAEATVIDNDVTAEDDGIHVSGEGFLIQKNVVLGGGDNDACIHGGGANSGEISKNKCLDSAGRGIEVSACNDILVAGNTVLRCGSINSDPGIVISGATNITASKNTVEGCGADGIRVDASQCTVAGNKVRNNGEDGIQSAGNDNVFDKNVVTGNLAEGLEITSGVNVTVTNNIAKRNRTDIANTGTIATFTGNVFVTGGPSTPGEVDD